MPKFIGRDVDVFSISLAGRDGNGAGGQTTSYLGKWESVSITLKNDWCDVSSSDAYQPEKRKKMQDFSGSLKGWVDDGGSIALEAFLNADLIIFSFHDVASGRTLTVRAGISKSDANFNMESGKDTLDFEDVGPAQFGGAQTLYYG